LKLKVSWLAWKDIESGKFLREFRQLWNVDLREAEVLIEKSGFQVKIKEADKVGLTLQPNVSFAFSPLDAKYLINVWSFFFCSQEVDSSVFFRPAFLLANELIHEHAHYRFWLDHGMLEKNKDAKEQFDKTSGIENERTALTAELSFFKKIMPIVPDYVNIKLFRIKSWKSKGRPNCEGMNAQIPTRENIIQNITSIEKAIKELSSKKIYDSTMESRATNKHSSLASVLKMDFSQNNDLKLR
jgi:hypothetical protein